MTIAQLVQSLREEGVGRDSSLLSAAWQRRERVLDKVANVQLVMGEDGARAIALKPSDLEEGELVSRPLSDNFSRFVRLPESFRQAFLQQQVKDFLYETFCLGDRSFGDAAIAANNELSGGIHSELLNRLIASNYGQGYFDAGWQVVEDLGEELAVMKQGVVIYVEKHRHLQDEDALMNWDAVSIRLPEYRFEPGFYVAVGDAGPVVSTPSIEFYMAAEASAVTVVLEAVTKSFNAVGEAIPYTLRLPYQLGGYRAQATGAETVALRTVESAGDRAVIVLEEIVRACSCLSAIAPEDLVDWDKPALRPDCSIFAYPIFPGVSMAVADSDADWFGGWADRSCCEALAQVLVAHWTEADKDRDCHQQLLKSRLTSALELRGFGWQLP